MYLSVRVDRKVPKERHKAVEGLESMRSRTDSAHPSPSLTSPILSVKGRGHRRMVVGALEFFPYVSYVAVTKRFFLAARRRIKAFPSGEGGAAQAVTDEESMA